jgi:hypothetical protein
VEVGAVDGQRLSAREQQVLTQIETMLSEDRHLDEDLRNFRVSVWTRCTEQVRTARTAALTLLALTAAILLIAAIRRPTPGLIAALAVTWAMTLGLGLATLLARTRRSSP